MDKRENPLKLMCGSDSSLLHSLHSCLVEFRYSPLHLPESGAVAEEIDLQTLILKEAIGARQADRAKLSLALLEIAIEHGFESLWLVFNKALALRQMGDLAGAIASWEGLAGLEGMPEFSAKVTKQLEETKELLAEQQRGQALSVLAAVHERLEQASRAALHVPASDAEIDEIDLQSLILKEAIAARNDREPQLSLDLLDAAIEHGFESLWLVFNKALALRQMGDLAGAIASWEDLAGLEGMPEFSAKVTKQLEETKALLAEQQRGQALSVLAAVHERLGQASRAALHMPASDAEIDEIDLQALILKEAIAARNDRQPQLSLDLLDAAIEHGFESLWLFHNKALALRDLCQYDAACGIWEGLSVHEIKGFSEKVKRCLVEVELQRVIANAADVEKNGDLELAIEMLLPALVQDPASKELNTALGAYLRKRRTGGDQDSDPFQAAQYLDQLDINDAFLMAVRSQLNIVDEAV